MLDIVQPDGNEIASSLVELYTGDLAIASNSINEKSELSVPYIGAYTYRAITRRPNTVVIQDEFSSGKEEEGSCPTNSCDCWGVGGRCIDLG